MAEKEPGGVRAGAVGRERETSIRARRQAPLSTGSGDKSPPGNQTGPHTIKGSVDPEGLPT